MLTLLSFYQPLLSCYYMYQIPFLFDDIKQVWADSVIATIPVGNYPIGVAYDSNDSRVYVPDYVSRSVSVIDTKTNTVNATDIPIGSELQGIAYDSNDGRVYVANLGSNTVSVIDTKTNTVNATIPVGSEPNYVAYNQDDGEHICN